MTLSPATRMLVVSLAALWAGGVRAADPPAGSAFRFHRVHVPVGRLGDVRLGDDRYVPMSIDEFEAAVARAAEPRPQAEAGIPRAVADTATYSARLDEAGQLTGLVTCSIPPAAAAVMRALPLGRLAARRGTFAGESGARDAIVFGSPTAGISMQTLEGGIYSCEFVCPPVVPGEARFRLPLVASLATTVELQLPAAAVPEVFGVAARHAVVVPPADPEQPWRIEVGPGDELEFEVQTRRNPPVGLAVWSALEIRGQQAALATTVRPSDRWGNDSVVLEKDATVRITAVQSGPDAEPLDWEESADGRQIVVVVPRWMAGCGDDLAVHGVAPAVGPTWRLPLVTAPQQRWSAGGSVVTIDPAAGVAAVDLDDCRIVTAAVAGRWPAPRVRDPVAPATDESATRPAAFNVEEQAPGATCRMSLRPRVPTFDVARATTVEISPRALLGRCVCDIRVVDGEAFELTARLAPGWIPDSVELLEWGDEVSDGEQQPPKPVASPLPVDWRFVQSPGGDSLRIGLPLAATPTRSLGLRIAGHRAGLQPGAAFMTSDIDMVRFDGEAAGMAVIDIKTVADSFMEIDEAPVGMLPAGGRLARLVEGGTIRGRITGGDLAPNRRARLVMRRPPVDVDVAVRLEALDDRLTQVFGFECLPETGGLESLVVDFSEPVGEGLEWSVASPEGIAVTARPLMPGDAAVAAAKRAESIAESWLLEFRPAVEAPVVVRARRTIPFVAVTPVPLAWVREAREAQGTVSIVSTGRPLPDVLNHRLLELPTRPDGPAADVWSLEFAFGPPPQAAGPTAELWPPDGGVDARAWAWREDISCWCEESGLVEYESRFDIENEGRDAVAVTVPTGQRLQGVVLDGVILSGDAVAAAGTTLRVPLPVAARRVELVVRTTLSREPAASWWRVIPQGCSIDLPVLERTNRLLLPPGLEAVMADGGYRPADPAATDWSRRLFGMASAAVDDHRESQVTEAGFRAADFVARGGRGVVVIKRRLLVSAALIAALIAGGIVLLAAPRHWSLAVTICLGSAVAAVWAPCPFDEVARAAWWAALAGTACGIMTRRRAVAAAVVCTSLMATPLRAGETESFRVFVTPGSSGDMALVPEALFRQLVGAGQAAAAVRVVRCDVFAPQAGNAVPWRVELDLDADAGGTLLIAESGRATWRPVGDAAAGGVLVRPDGNGVRLTASTAGRRRVTLAVTPWIERRGELETAELRLPAAPAAAVHLGGDPLPANVVVCERSAAGRPFMRVPVADSASSAAVFDVSGADRVRLLRPLDPRDRIAAEPTTATTSNDVFWGLDACTVQTTVSLEAADLLYAVPLRVDERLERLEVAGGPGTVSRGGGPGEWLLEFPRATRGKTEVRLVSRMPLTDPVGRFRVPAVWIEGLAGEVRTLRVEAAADLDIVVDPPVGGGITAAEFANGAAPQATVRRRRQQPRGVQNLAVTFGDDRVTLALRAQIDAATLAITEIPVQVPPGCIIDGVSLRADDLVAADGRPQPAVDIVWTRTATDRVVVVVQQPRAGRFWLVVDARLRIRPAARGRVPLVRAEIGGAPLIVSCVAEPAGGLAVRLAEGAAERASGPGSPRGDTKPELAEVFADEPGPGYVLETIENTSARIETETPTTAAPATVPGESRVELTDVLLAIDGRGRGRGAVRFSVHTSEQALRLRLPRGMRLYDLLVDGGQVPTVPRAADTWEVRLHGMAWPRTILAIFAGDVGAAFVDGAPISLPPPELLGLPSGDVLWTVLPPPGFAARLATPARPLDTDSQLTLRRDAQQRIAARFDLALQAADARQQERLRQLVELRRGGGVTTPESDWQQAVGWPSPAGSDSAAACAATPASAELTLRVVRRPDGTVPGRAMATGGLVLAAAAAWRLSARKAGGRRQAESDLAGTADHR